MYTFCNTVEPPCSPATYWIAGLSTCAVPEIRCGGPKWPLNSPPSIYSFTSAGGRWLPNCRVRWKYAHTGLPNRVNTTYKLPWASHLHFTRSQMSSITSKTLIQPIWRTSTNSLAEMTLATEVTLSILGLGPCHLSSVVRFFSVNYRN